MKPGSSTYQNLGIAVAATFLFSLIAADLMRVRVTQASLLDLPEPAAMVPLSRPVELPVLKGLRLDPARPLDIQFVVSPGDSEEISREEAQTLVRYFLAGLTVPERDLWVNLSPYEEDRIAPEALGDTDMGKDLLAQDYVLKQLLSSVTCPDSDTGRDFWNSTYARLAAELGTTAVPVNTFNKVWIVPGAIEVQECNGLALISKAGLKAMMEEDYLALDQNAVLIRSNAAGVDDERIGQVNKITSSVMREAILPLIETDVNEGKNFARLRQVYHSLILSLWFKKKFADSFYRHYIDQAKTQGIDLDDPALKDKIYGLYVKAFEKGVYDLIRKTYDPAENKYVRRRYFSGGMQFDKAGSAIREVSVSSAEVRRDILPGYRLLDTRLKNVGYDVDANAGGQSMEVERGLSGLYDHPADTVAAVAPHPVVDERIRNYQRVQQIVGRVQEWMGQAQRIGQLQLRGEAAEIMAKARESLMKKIRRGMGTIRQYDFSTFEIYAPYAPLQPEVRQELLSRYDNKAADRILALVMGRLGYELRGRNLSIEQAMGELTFDELMEKSIISTDSLPWDIENPLAPVDVLMEQWVHAPVREDGMIDYRVIEPLREENPAFRKAFDAWFEETVFEVDVPLLEQVFAVTSAGEVDRYAGKMTAELAHLNLAQLLSVKDRLITQAQDKIAVALANGQDTAGYVRYLDAMHTAFRAVHDEQGRIVLNRAMFPVEGVTLSDLVNDVDVARFEASIDPAAFAQPTQTRGGRDMIAEMPAPADPMTFVREINEYMEKKLAFVLPDAAHGGAYGSMDGHAGIFNGSGMSPADAGGQGAAPFRKGGIDLQGMDIQASAGSALMQLAPFDINDFKGFTFEILSMDKLDAEEKILALVE